MSPPASHKTRDDEHLGRPPADLKHEKRIDYRHTSDVPEIFLVSSPAKEKAIAAAKTGPLYETIDTAQHALQYLPASTTALYCVPEGNTDHGQPRADGLLKRSLPT